MHRSGDVRQWRAKQVRLLSSVVRGLRGSLRDHPGWVRRPPELWRLPITPPPIRGLSRSRAIQLQRGGRVLHADQLRARGRKVRPDRRRLRRNARLWQLRGSNELRRGRHYQPVRLHQEHLRCRRGNVRNALRSLWRHALLRRLRVEPSV